MFITHFVVLKRNDDNMQTTTSNDDHLLMFFYPSTTHTSFSCVTTIDGYVQFFSIRCGIMAPYCTNIYYSFGYILVNRGCIAIQWPNVNEYK